MHKRAIPFFALLSVLAFSLQADPKLARDFIERRRIGKST